MPNSDYHRRQADLLMCLAETISDTGTARHLRAMAADHIALADQYAALSMDSPSAAEKPWSGKAGPGNVLG
jgi:hypothetical protein